MSVDRDDPRVRVVERVLMDDLHARALANIGNPREQAIDAPSVTDMAVHVLEALEAE